MGSYALYDSLDVANDTEFEWFSRTTALARLYLMRCLDYLEVQYQKEIAQDDDVIKSGESLHWLCFRASYHATYNLLNNTKSNPYMLGRSNSSR